MQLSISGAIYLYLALLLSACGSPKDLEKENKLEVSCEISQDASDNLDLIDPFEWKSLEKELDPFERKANHIQCIFGEGFFNESLGGVEVMAVKTETCNYITLSQSSLKTIKKGDKVLFRFYYYDLVEPKGEKAYISVKIEDEFIWQKTYKIPSKSQLEKVTWTATKDFPACSNIYFNVSNHGKNEYVFVELSIFNEE